VLNCLVSWCYVVIALADVGAAADKEKEEAEKGDAMKNLEHRSSLLYH
jgi:hypothetical protein